MLSKVTDSEANKKTKADTTSGKLTEATSVIVPYEERGEGELEVDTPVSTTISTAGGPASPSREWPCSSIACDGCDQHTPAVRSPYVRVAGLVGGLKMGARRALAARV